MTKYLQSLKGAKASQEGYNASLKATSIGSKAAAAGITFLNVALNSLVTMGVSLVIQGLVTWISKLATAQQDAIDTANEMAEAYKSTTNGISANIKSIESVEKEFEKLSRGVDEYGNNIALSADEYARYKEIVEQIVGISPSLITGYDKEGNAIANKNGLIERSIELMKEEQRLRLEEITSDEALKKLASGKIGEYNKYQQDNPMNRKDNRLADGTVFEFGQLLESIQEKSTEYDDYDFFKLFGLSDKWNDFYGGTGRSKLPNLVTKYYDEISDMVINKRSELSEVLSQDDLDALEKLILKHNQNTATYESQLEQYAQKLNPSLQLVPQTLTAYQEMTDAQKEFIAQYVNGFRITADTTEKDVLEMSQSIKDFADLLANDDTAKQAINDFFALDKTALSASDWQSQANSFVDSVANALQLTEEEKLQLKVGLGIVFVDNQGKEVNSAESLGKEAVIKFGGKYSSDFLQKMFTEDELKFIVNCDVVFDTTGDPKKQVEDAMTAAIQTAQSPLTSLNSFTSLQSQFASGEIDSNAYVEALEAQLKAINDLTSANPKLTNSYKTIGDSITAAIATAPSTLEAAKAATDALGSSAKTLSSVFAEQSENGKLSLESISSVIDAGYASALAVDAETGAVTLNADAYMQLAQAKIAEQIVSLSIKRDAIVQSIKAETETINGLSMAYQFMGNSAILAARQEAEAKRGVFIGSQAATDAQIAGLKELQENLGKVTAGTYGGGGGSQSDPLLEAYQKEYAELQHLRNMDLITNQEYYNKLERLSQHYFAGKSKYLEEDRKNLEELHKLQRELFKDTLTDREFEIEQLKRQGATTEQQKELYTQMIADVQREIEAANKYGLDSNSDYIQELTKQWATYQDNLISVYESVVDAEILLLDSKIEKINEEKDASEKASKAKIDGLDREIDRLKERQKYLDDMTEKYRTAASVAVDAIDEQIKALQDENKAIEDKNKLLEAQEALENAKKQKNVRVYHEDKGWTWESDKKAVKDAEKNLKDTETDMRIAELEAYKQKWQDAVDSIGKAQDKRIADEILGAGWEADILAMRTDIIDNFSKEYAGYSTELNDIVLVQIEALENQKTSLEDAQKRNAAVYEQQILDLENLKTQWENITAKYEEQQAILLLQEEFGTIKEKEYLDTRFANVQKFVADYLAEMAKLNGINGNPQSFSEGTTNFDPNTPAYATGTRNAKSGWAKVDEKGKEILGRDIVGRYTRLDKGETVLPHRISKNLWDIGNDPMQFLRQNIALLSSNTLGKSAPVVNTTNNDHSTHINGVTINSKANSFDKILREATVKSRNR